MKAEEITVRINAKKRQKSVTNGQKSHKSDCIFDSFAIKTVQITRKRWTNQYFQQSK